MDSQKGFSFDLNELPHREDDNTRPPKNGRTLEENPNICFPADNNEIDASKTLNMVGCDNHIVAEREEGEWSDVDECGGACEIYTEGSKGFTEGIQNHSVSEPKNYCSSTISARECYSSGKVDDTNQESSYDFNVEKCTNSDGKMMTSQGEVVLNPKNKNVKGIEKANNLSRKSSYDLQKEAMLGKKRNRQTMFLNLEDIKQVGPVKNPTLRRPGNQFPSATRTVREPHTHLLYANNTGEKPCFLSDKKLDESCNGGLPPTELSENESENIGGMNSGFTEKLQNCSSTSETCVELHPLAASKQDSRKPQSELRHLKNSAASKRKTFAPSQSTVEIKQGSRKLLTSRKQSQGQDTSVERLIREVTSEMFWPHPRVADLQQIPGSFESVEEYISVFEPLLFEECRAQFINSWEEQKEGSSRDMHVMVRIKWIDRRERGWHDVVLAPVNECKWKFKEGDVAVLSSPKSGAGKSKRVNHAILDNGDKVDIKGRVAGTVRRHSSNDSREPPGAILHFFVGDSNNHNSKGDGDHILSMLQPKALWHLTVLGSLATTQREYIALHAFRRLNDQMQAAILRPSRDLFPKYEDTTPPSMHDCFTPNFVDHLHRTFNPPQLSAIHWAAMHTSAGTIPSLKKQDPWPFTLVQGPPGTGKTHTVWGMLNVIHLVQYQHYYTSLLKKLAPESYDPPPVHPPSSSSSIDQLLHTMDHTLLRTLPTLCPKPRILVCAPSNAATDELLSRVLSRGFIDGEMKVYRPDVARVGVDSQTRAAQAVSVERRTDQLLVKTKEEILTWLHQLRARDLHLSHHISILQRDLLSAAAGRSDGSLGVDPAVLAARDQSRDTLLKSLAAVVEERDKVIVDISRLLLLQNRFRRNHNLEEIKADLEASFADEAEIVFTTVSSSGRKLFSRLTHGFDMVVIDEAAQASEVSVLPPLSLDAARCVLVGDPQQLPATVISKAAGTLFYSRSLLERFQLAGCPTLLLSVQYRMHPYIREFPSLYFYNGRLSDSDSVTNLPDEPYHHDQLLRPFIFYDVTHGRESHRAGSVSYQNLHEARFCRLLYGLLRRSMESGNTNTTSVGIITPYKLQLKCLEREFYEVIQSQEEDVYINTVDAFQGQERDVIIMSCVRASGHGVGFVADVRRMNVALTRARRALWIAGNAAALAKNDDWAALIAHAKSRHCFLTMDSLPRELLAAATQDE